MPGHPPLVSIYVPTRDRPEMLQRAVESAQAQSYERLQIVVAVDGPDPDTESLLAALARGDARVEFVVRERSGGACAARNSAMERARGELITGLDDDDELIPTHVEELVAAFNPAREAFVCTTSVLRRKTSDQVRQAFEGPITLDDLLYRNVVGNQVLTLTERLRAIGGFDPAFPAWQDYDCWVRLADRFGAGRKLDARSYITRADHDAVRVTTNERIEAAHRLFLEKHRGKLSPAHEASLELLMLANTHRRFPATRLPEFARHGLLRRALSAYVGDRVPALQALARRLPTLS